ncbi:MAG: RidA family protein [Magnetococcus sp. YQC-3]
MSAILTGERLAIETPLAPQAIGPYSQGVRVGQWLFLSGQIPLDPKTGELCTGDVAAQTERVMENLSAVLAAAGVGFAQLVKTTLYLVEMGDFAAVNAVYARYVEPPYPARSTIGVAALPRGAKVEIDAVAWLPL